MFLSARIIKGKIKEYIMGGSYNIQVQQDTQPMYKRNTEVRSRNHCCHGKEIRNTSSECVFVALVVQHAKDMRRVILSSVACLDLHYFSRIFGKKNY